jgi:hypothetical protein
VTGVVNVNDLLNGHVSLDIECLDRIYLNAYIPNLQVGGQVVTFLTAHRGYPIPSPALFAPIGNAFRDAVKAFAEREGIPLIRFRKHERKIDRIRPLFLAATHLGVVAIGIAQEFQSVLVGYRRETDRPGAVNYGFAKTQRRVTVYYFYLLDAEFGTSFIKLCSYFPYPAKVWVNGHEWAKRQAAAVGLGYTELSNGFAACADAAQLQAICDRLGPRQVQAFFAHWMAALPVPLSATDRQAGYWWELSMRQIEVSRTLVFDAPRRGRAFFEAVVADNLDLGRPDEVQLIFGRQIRRNTVGRFATKVVTRGVDVTVNVFYRNSRIKEYLKDGRALRLETVVNAPGDLGCQRRLRHLPELTRKARAANRRLLKIQRAGQSCALSTALFERVAQPTFYGGHRTGALRFGESRVMALTGALCGVVHTVSGFSNRSLRARVAGLLGTGYAAAQMTYDLRRLRTKGIIRRLEGRNRYVLTPDGIKVALFYTKLQNRLLAPLLAADQPPASPDLRRALKIVESSVEDYIAHARLRPAA